MDNPVMSDNKQEMTVKELAQSLSSVWRFLISKFWRICLVGLLGSGFGLLLSFIISVKYKSTLTFVVEEGKTSGGGLAALAGQFGFDIGSAGSGGLFAGENVLLFLKSETLCRETLMTPYDSTGKVTLADRYAEVTKLKNAWAKSKKIGAIDFTPYVNKPLPRLHDSLLQLIIRKRILSNNLQIVKPDKKATFIQVEVVMPDEKLSALFAERLVNVATRKYIESKIKVKATNVAILQRRADSLAALLDQKTFNAALSQQTLVDVNPALRTAPIYAEINTRDKTMIATIFAEVVKNLEISKTILNQETPVIQMVDQSPFPLEQVKFGKLKGLVLGGLLFGFVYIGFLIISRWLKAQLQ